MKHFICDKQNTVFLKIIQEKYIENEKNNDYTCEINENATAAIESLSNFHKYSRFSIFNIAKHIIP